MKSTALSLFVVFVAACAQGEGTPDDLSEPDDATGESRVHLMPLHTPQVEALREARAAASKPKLVYYGGPVLSNAKVEIVYWNDASKVFGQGQLESYYRDITDSAYFDWLNEYNTPTQKIGRGSLLGSATATGAKVGSITDADIQTQLTSMIRSGTVDTSDPANTLYMVHFPPGMSISQGGSASCVQFCAYHGTFTYQGHDVFYGVIPDQGADGCESGCGKGDHLQNTTSTASHELIEAVTDAAVGLATTNGPPLAWYDNANGEIGDICVTGTSYTSVVGKWTVQNEWSNKAGKCIATSGTAPPPPADDFGISLSGDATVAAGASTTVTVATTRIGSAETVTLAVSGLPRGVTGSLSPISVSSGDTATLTLSAATGAAAGRGSFTVTGTASTGSHSASGNVTVTTTTPPPPPSSDFSVSLSPSTVTVSAGSSASLTVTTAVVSGTPGPLALTVSGLPAGVTGTFSPPSVAAGGRATLTIAADATAKAGHATVDVTAADGGNAHDATANVTVNAGAPPPPPPTSGNLITNGDFESIAAGWTRGGNALITTRAFHDGTHSALVGTSGSVFGGDSYLYQAVAVPPGATTLSFWHLMRCRDPLGGGEIAAFIADTSGDVLDAVYDTCATDASWTQETYDLSPFAGQTVYVYFYTFSTGFYTAASWQYIDGVEVTNE